MDEVWNGLENFSKAMNELYKKKEERARQNRIKAQNNPYTKRRKSEAMKKYWKEKKQKAIDELVRVKDCYEYSQECCVCHLGNPPCGYCTSSNFCEECDVVTHDEECPKCGKVFDKE